MAVKKKPSIEPIPPNLFQKTLTKLSSGRMSEFKIEFDAATDADILCFAYLIKTLVGPFSSVEGVPRGGIRLQEALKKYLQPIDTFPHLIVDDVLTSGMSMSLAQQNYRLENPTKKIVGAVAFSRGPLPSWIKAIFPMPIEFWDK